MNNQETMQSPEKFETRKLSSADWEQYRNLRMQALETDPQAFGGTLESESAHDAEYWKTLLDNPERVFFAAEKENAFIASAGAKKIQDREDMYAIIGVYTLPVFRGKGLSSKLISNIENELRSRNVKELELWVNASTGCGDS